MKDVRQLVAKGHQEYKHLCELIGGKNPYGDCQLVALMLHLAIPESVIIEGVIECIDRDVNHFWVRIEEIDVDPLSIAWNTFILSRKVLKEVGAEEILQEYKSFIEAFPEPSEYSFFPLRWKVYPSLSKYLTKN